MRILAALVVVPLLLSGCGGNDDRPTGAPDRPSSSTGSTTATPTPAPWRTVPGPLERCGPIPAEVARTPFRHQVLRDPEVGAIPSVRAGSGPTLALLLHQTDGNGLCGSLPFATDLLAEPGTSVLAIDLCRYGASDCRAVDDGTFTEADQTDAVRVAIEHARASMGARRIVVVGASMGGSVALMTAATLPHVDSAVDLSGPVDWPGTDVVRGGRALRVPVLVAMADDEGPEEVAGARAIVRRAPEGSRFAAADAGHGYALLNDVDGNDGPLSGPVLEWIRAVGNAAE
jgi:dienelactone hydrolase